jgi:hypothetical protein
VNSPEQRTPAIESNFYRWETGRSVIFNSWDASVRTCSFGTIARLTGNVKRQADRSVRSGRYIYSGKKEQTMTIQDDETLQMYLEESIEHLADIETDLLAIEEGRC